MMDNEFSHTPDVLDEFRMMQAEDTLDAKLKKTLFGGYTKRSVQEYIQDLGETSNRLKESLEQQIRDLSAECQKLTNESAILRAQTLQAENDKAQVEKELADSVSDNSKTIAAGKALEAEIEELHQKLSDYENQTTEVDRLQASLQEALTLLENKEQERVLAADALKSAESQLAELQEENSRLSSSKNNSEVSQEKLNDLQLKIQKLEDENEALRKTLDQKEEAFKASDEKRRWFAQEYGTNRGQLDALTEEAAKLRFDMKAAEEEHIHELERLNATLEAKDKKLKDVTDQYSALHSQYRGALQKGAELASEKEAMAELLEQHQNKEREYALLRKKDETQKETIAELEGALHLILQEMEGQLENYKKIVGEQNADKELICKLTQEKAELQIENVGLLDKAEQLTRKVSEVEQENVRLTRRNRPYGNSISLHNDQIKPQAEKQTVCHFPGDESDSWVKKARDISGVYEQLKSPNS